MQNLYFGTVNHRAFAWNALPDRPPCSPIVTSQLIYNQHNEPQRIRGVIIVDDCRYEMTFHMDINSFSLDVLAAHYTRQQYPLCQSSRTDPVSANMS